MSKIAVIASIRNWNRMTDSEFFSIAYSIWTIQIHQINVFDIDGFDVHRCTCTGCYVGSLHGKFGLCMKNVRFSVHFKRKVSVVHLCMWDWIVVQLNNKYVHVHDDTPMCPYMGIRCRSTSRHQVCAWKGPSTFVIYTRPVIWWIVRMFTDTSQCDSLTWYCIGNTLYSCVGLAQLNTVSCNIQLA